MITNWMLGVAVGLGAVLGFISLNWGIKHHGELLRSILVSTLCGLMILGTMGLLILL